MSARPASPKTIVSGQLPRLKGLLMSALGHKRTYALQDGMSALPLKADIAMQIVSILLKAIRR